MSRLRPSEIDQCECRLFRALCIWVPLSALLWLVVIWAVWT